MPVVGEDGRILGMMTEGNLMSMLVKKRVSKDDPVSKVLYKSFKQVPTTATLGHVSRLLDREPFVLVVSEQRCSDSTGNDMSVKQTIYSIVTRIDLLNFIMSSPAAQAAAKKE